MTTIDTHPFRVWMTEYAMIHGLAHEEGFSPAVRGPLKGPGQDFLKRIQKHMIATNSADKVHGRAEPYPGVKVTGILDAPTRDALTPDRPSFEAAFRQIATQDDKLDGEEYYTQGAARWAGVESVYGVVKVMKAAPRLKSGDCSAGYTRWVLWGLQQSMGKVPRDVVNGASWRAGYTGTIQAVCAHVKTPKIGDAILYPNHVTGVFNVKDRTCISHGRDRAEIYGWDSHPGRYEGFWRPRYSNV